MRAEELLELIRKRPFAPLRLHTTEGLSYDIRHPDQVIALRGRVDVGVTERGQNGVAKRVEHLSLLHIIRVEEVDSARREKP